MTIYEIHYRNGKTYRLSYTELGVPLTGTNRWLEVRRLARQCSGNRSGAVKIVRYMTGKVEWELAAYQPLTQ